MYNKEEWPLRKKKKARLPVRSRDNEHQDDYLRRFPCNHVYSKQCTTTFALFRSLHIVPSRRNSRGAIARTIVERKRQHVYPLSLSNQRGEMHCQRQNHLAKGSAERNDRIKWLWRRALIKFPEINSSRVLKEFAARLSTVVCLQHRSGRYSFNFAPPVNRERHRSRKKEKKKRCSLRNVVRLFPRLFG